MLCLRCHMGIVHWVTTTLDIACDIYSERQLMTTFAPQLTCYAFNCNFLRKQFRDVPSDRVDEIPFEGAKAPRWVAGHLAEGQYFLASFLGVDSEFPETWLAAFAPGTPSTSPYGLEDESNLPSVDELLDYISATEQPIVEAAKTVTVESLSEPHGLEILSGTGIDTKADLVAHLMTTHFAFHAGQLSLWRRAIDVQPLF